MAKTRKKNCTNCQYLGRVGDDMGMCFNLHPMVNTKPVLLSHLKKFKCSEYKRVKGT